MGLEVHEFTGGEEVPVRVEKEEDAEQGRESLRSQHRFNRAQPSTWSLRSQHRSNKRAQPTPWSIGSQHRSSKGSFHSMQSFGAQRLLTGEIPHFSIPQKELGLPSPCSVIGLGLLK